MRRATALTTVFLCFIVFSQHATAQVTNLTVNGSSTTFTMVQGDSVQWEYDLPVGATADGEIWFDLNGNGAIDVFSDKPLFIFTQTDGDTSDIIEQAVPDMDGQVNGHIFFAMRVGLAPAQYVLKFTHSGVGDSVLGTATPLSSPAFTVSGNVTPPPGESAEYILLEAGSMDEVEPEFWNALTDQNGDYTINFDAAAGSSQWRVAVEDEFPPYVVTPAETTLSLSGNITGINFEFLAAAAQMVGYLKDDNDVALVGVPIHLRRNDGAVHRLGDTDSSGFFQIGLSAGDLTGLLWQIDSHNIEGDVATTHMAAIASDLTVNPGDSLVKNLVAYTINNQIQGQVTVNGGLPGMPFRMMATNSDTGYSRTLSDSATGNFSFGVSNKVYDYEIYIDLPPGYMHQSVLAHPGDAGIVIDITTTSVDRREPGVPSAHRLYQNYPNPFNPSTRIDYDIATRSYVRLTIYDLLGHEIATLVDEEQPPGQYQAHWVATGLASGVYLYRLQASTLSRQAGEFTGTKKLVLMK